MPAVLSLATVRPGHPWSGWLTQYCAAGGLASEDMRTRSQERITEKSILNRLVGTDHWGVVRYGRWPKN